MRRLLIALLLAVGCGPPPAGDAAHMPKGPLRAVAPSGLVAWPFEFRWEGGAATSVVRIHVTDEAERPLQEIEVRGERAPAPDALRELLTPGTTYLWRVARLDDNGQERDGSGLTRFKIQ